MALSFREVGEQWKADKRRWVKPSSYATYVNHINAHIYPFFEDIPSEELSEQTVLDFIIYLTDKGLRERSVRDMTMVLKMILRHGAKMGAWPNFDLGVRIPRRAGVPENGVAVLSQQEQKSLLKYLSDNFSFRNLGLQLCLLTGLRIGEVCGLQWRDLDVAAGVVHVRKTVQRIWLEDGSEHEYFLHVGPPKTFTSMRDIPICRELMRLLRPLRKVMSDDYFVVSNKPAPLEPRYLRDYFRKTLARVGIPPVRFHALRHSFATRCIESRCDYKTVSAILGHSSISTTLDLYVHPGYREMKQAIDRMSRSLGV